MGVMDARLADLAFALSRSLTVVDVGCRWGPAAAWLELPGVRVIGFDPDEEECRRLAERTGERAAARFVPVALGRHAGPARLHLTHEPACSSLYPPDVGLIETRPALVVITPAGQTDVELDTLDAWTEREGVDRVDFVKLDTQGSELDILRGAERILQTVRAIEVEVEFNPIYQGQPLFGDVDDYLRTRGFVLWRLGDLAHYSLPGGVSDFPTTDTHHYDVHHPVTVAGTGGQLYWANAFYVRREIAFPPDDVPWETALADALLTGALGFWDLAHLSALRASGAPAQTAARLQAFADASTGRSPGTTAP
jgi:FkbM family methyltransferase